MKKPDRIFYYSFTLLAFLLKNWASRGLGVEDPQDNKKILLLEECCFSALAAGLAVESDEQEAQAIKLWM